MAFAASGLPNRFLTLTVDPRIGTDQADRLRLLSNAWRVVRKRLMRKYGKHSIEFFAVVEETKQGEPHLHILLRSPYIPQALISSAMAQLIDSPIVDIRRIKSARDVVRYVAKYITKAPKQFGTAKRYWSSTRYEIKDREGAHVPDKSGPRWLIDRRSVTEILNEWYYQGFATRRDHADVLVGIPIPGFYLQRGSP